MTGNLSFDDNAKATFGDGSDLQIYHAGAYSIITDVGTGDFFTGGATGLLTLATRHSDYATS